MIIKRHQLLAFILFFSSLILAANLLQGQNIGIGTTTPGQKLEVNGNLKIGDNILVGGTDNYKVYQNLASYSSTSSSVTGAILITTNQNPLSNMWSITIKGHNNVALSYEFVITGVYLSASYTFRGSLDMPVSIGLVNGGSRLVVILGTVSTVHNQPKVTVTEFRQGQNLITESAADSWQISLVTDLSTVTSQTSLSKTNNDLWSLTGSDIYYNSGKVGMGLSSPLYPLHVSTNANTTGWRAVYGINNAASTGAQLYGMMGEVRSTETTDPGAGVYGYHNAASGSSAGVRGVSNSTTGRGVFGYATDVSGTNYGIYGKTGSMNGYAGYFEGGMNFFSGDVGIGVYYPEEKLHVKFGNAMVENSTAFLYMDATSTTTGQAGLILQENGTSRKSLYIANSNDNFYIYDNLATRFDLSITPAGDVGIGTGEPGARLHVVGGSAKIESSNPFLVMKSSISNGSSGVQFNNHSDVFKRSIYYSNSSDRLNFFNATNSTTDMVILGNGNIGIGTAAPDSHLEVSSAGSQTIRVTSEEPPNEIALEFIRFNYGGTDYVDWKMIDQAGSLKFIYSNNDFSTGSDGFTFNYNGTTSSFMPIDNGNKNLGGSSNRWNTVYAVNGTIQTSDLLEKENINDISYGLEEVMKLHPVSYTWKKWPEEGARLGLIAQEVEPVIAEVVKKEQDIRRDEWGNITSAGDYTYGMSYDQLIPVLVKAIQEQQARIVELEGRILELDRPSIPILLPYRIQEDSSVEKCGR